jgi:hypothetical protein
MTYKNKPEKAAFFVFSTFASASSQKHHPLLYASSPYTQKTHTLNTTSHDDDC